MYQMLISGFKETRIYNFLKYFSEACVICGMRATLMATQKSGGAPIKPWQVYSKLRLICRHLTPGRQEDAHEFLRYLEYYLEKALHF